MAAILANCRGYKIGDKVDGTVSEQVETGLNCSLIICDYGKGYTRRQGYLAMKNKTENTAEIVFLRGGGVSKKNALYINKIMSILLKSAIIGLN